MIRIEYRLPNGKQAFSLYHLDWFTIEEAKADLLTVMPDIKIIKAYISQIRFLK